MGVEGGAGGGVVELGRFLESLRCRGGERFLESPRRSRGGRIGAASKE